MIKNFSARVYGYVLPLTLGFLVVTGAVALYYPFSEAVAEQAASTRDAVMKLLEDELDADISYAKADPIIVNFLDITDLAIRFRASQDRLIISRLRISYDLLGMLVPRTGRARIHEISIENGQFFLSEARLRSLAERAAEIPSGPIGPVRISGRNLSLNLNFSGGQLQAEKVFFQLTPADQHSALRLRAVLKGSFSPGAAIQGFETVCTVNGSLSSDLTRTSLLAKLTDFRTESFGLTGQALQLSWDRSSLHLVSVEGRRPLDLNADYDFASGRLSLFLRAEKLDPSTLVKFSGSMARHDAWLSTTSLSGKVWIDLETKNGNFSYQGLVEAESTHPFFRRRTRLQAEAAGDGASIAVKSLSATSLLGSVGFSGGLDFATLMPSGEFELKDFRFFGDKPITAKLELISGAGALAVFSRSLRYGDWTVYDAAGLASWSRDKLDLSLEAALTAGGAPITAELVYLFASREARGELVLAGARSRDLHPLVSSLLPANLRQPTAQAPPYLVSGLLQVQWRGGEVSLDAPFIRFDSEGNPLDSLFVQGLALRSAGEQPGSLRVDGYSLAAGPWRSEGSLAGIFETGGPIRLSAAFTVQDIPYQTNFIIRPEGIVEMQGSGELELRLSWDAVGTFSAWMHARSLELPVAGRRLTADFDLRGRYSSPDAWRIDIDRLKIPDLEPVAGFKAGLSLAGWAEPKLLVLRSLSIDDGYSRLGGDLSLNYDLAASRGALLGKLEDRDRRESYDFRVGVIDDLVSAAVSFRNSPLTRARVRGLSGSVSGMLALAWSASGLDWTVNAAIEDGVFNRDPFSLSLIGDKKGSQVIIESLSAAYAAHRIESGAARLDMRTGELSGRAAFSTSSDGKKLAFSADTRVVFAHGLSEFESPFSLFESDFSGSLGLRSQALSFAPGGTVRLEFEKTAHRTSVSSEPAAFLEGELSHDGAFSFRLRDPLPFSAEVSGSVRESMIDARVENLVLQIERAAPYWNMVFVHFLSGRCTGGLRISGMLNDPDFTGVISVSDGTGSIDIIPEVLPVPTFDLVFSGKELRFDGLTVSGKYTKADLNGRFQFDHWQIKSFTVNVELPPSVAAYGARVKSDFGAVAVDGWAQGTVVITGADRSVKVEGDLIASNTVISLGSNQAYSRPTDDFSVVVALKFLTGKGVEFFWPTRDYPVLRAVAGIDQKLAILIDGQGGQFTVNGDIAIRAGQVNYFSRTFYFKEGLIRFNERGDSFDPRLTVRAETREPTADGLARIYLVSDNNRLSQFSPRFETDSALTSTEILTLLNTDIIPVDRNKTINVSSAMLLTSDVVSQMGLVRSFEDSVRERLRLDLFTIRTHVFQNLLREVIQEPAYPLDTGLPSLGKYLDKTSVFLGKYLGTNLFLELLLQFQAVSPLQQQVREFGAVKIDSELLLEWKTPFFLLEWSFFPKTWKDLFIPDNKFAFSWKLSY